MIQKGGNLSIMFFHDAVTLSQGGFPVGGSHAGIEIIDKDQVGIINVFAFFIIRMHQSKSAENR